MIIDIHLCNVRGPCKDAFRDPATGEWIDRRGYEEMLQWHQKVGQHLDYYRARMVHNNQHKDICSPYFWRDESREGPLSSYMSRWQAYSELFKLLADNSYHKLHTA